MMIDDATNWQNKLISMSPEEIKLLPSEFLKKYGSYLNFM
jgi:hypothetical protein